MGKPGNCGMPKINMHVKTSIRVNRRFFSFASCFYV